MGLHLGTPRRCLAGALSLTAIFLWSVAPALADPPNLPTAGGYTTNGPVYSIARDGGRTYIGGDFTQVGLRTGSGALLSLGSDPAPRFPEVAGGDVMAAVSDAGGGWYIGGSFTSVGEDRHVGLAHVKADGSVDPTFRPEAIDFDGNPATVYSLAFSKSPDPSHPYPDEGILYAGGKFTMIRVGSSAEVHSHVAAVGGDDGRPVTQWGAGTDCTPQTNCSADVRALALAHVPLSVGTETVDIPVLVAGGDFNGSGQGGATRAMQGVSAIWGVKAVNSTNQAIGGDLVMDNDAAPKPWAPYPNGTQRVRALQMSSDGASLAIYIGGRTDSGPLLDAYQLKFADPTGRQANTVSAFFTWTPGPQGCAGTGCVPSVNALARDGSNLYFGGDFSTVQSATGPQPAQRVGTIQTVSDPSNAFGGTARTASSFGAVDGPVRAAAISSSGQELLLGGEFGHRLTALSTVDGAPTGWDPKPDAPVDALATDPSSPSVFAGGRFRSVGASARSGLAAFDASGALLDWAPGLAATDPGGPLVRALTASQGVLYVGGRFDTVTDRNGNAAARPNLAALNSSGDVLGFDAAPGRSGSPAEVLSLAMLGSTLYVGGSFDQIGAAERRDRRNLAALDVGTGSATSWDPGADDNVYAILPACGAIYVGGAFGHAGGQSRSHIAALDAGSGAALSWDPNADGAVFALARFGPTMYAGGNFATIGGQLRQKVAGLRIGDGTATDLDTGADGPVRALATSDSALYAGGTFGSIGNTTRDFLAALDLATGDARAWNPAPDASVRALALDDGALYAGGSFGSVGTAAQRGFAAFGSGAGSPFVATSCVSVTATTPPVPTPAAPAAVPSIPGSARPRARPVRITRASVSPARPRLGGAPLTIRFTLSRAARVRLRFERLKGRRYVRVAEVAGRAAAGRNRLSFPHQRVGRRRLPAGRYRLWLTAVPSARGTQGARVYFTLLAR